MDSKEAFAKACKYCAYQERTHEQVRAKLKEIGLWDSAIEEVILKLIENNFLNEERFAQAYVRGKFGQLKWGRNKILQGLKKHKLSPFCIKSGMNTIDGDEYFQTCKKLIIKKFRLTNEKNEAIKQKKILAYMQAKGYEWDIITEAYKEALNELNL